MSEDSIRVSKRLSYVLRHDPASIGLSLDANGWAEVEHLLSCLNAHGVDLDRAALDLVVAANPKKRFEIVGTRIRAVQGHSLPIDLGLDAVEPPDVLWHGTVQRFVPDILRDGLRAGSRTHVHLSGDQDTAYAVGARRGQPVILTVDSGALFRAGHEFFRAANGVWLTDAVPPAALRLTARRRSL